MRSTHTLKRRGSNLYLTEIFFFCIFLALFLIPVFGFSQDVKKQNQETPDKFGYLIENKPRVAETPSHEVEIRKAEKISTQEKFDVPVWEIGDTWVYQRADKRTWQNKVVRIEGNLYIGEILPSGNFRAYDKNTLEPKFNIDRTGRRTKLGETLFFDFPIYIGKEWKQIFSSPSLTGGNVVLEYKCVCNETINVQAGQFKGAKIRLKSTPASSAMSGEAFIWYSPEVKGCIKMTYGKTIYWAGDQDFELVSFKPKDKDVFLAQAEAEKKEVEEIPDKFSYLIENGAKMIKENQYENVLSMIEKLSSEKKWDFRIKVLENFAYLKGYLVSKNKEYGRNWQSFYKPMVFSRNKIATPILVELLRDDDPYVRSFTAKALGYLGDKRALEELKRVADQDQNSKMRSRAKWAYEQVAGDRSPEEPSEEDQA